MNNLSMKLVVAFLLIGAASARNPHHNNSARNGINTTEKSDGRRMNQTGFGKEGCFNVSAWLSTMPCLSSAQVAIINQCSVNVTNGNGTRPEGGKSGKKEGGEMAERMHAGINCVLNAIGAWNKTGGVNGTGAADPAVVESQIIKTSSLTSDQMANASASFYSCVASNNTFNRPGNYNRKWKSQQESEEGSSEESNNGTTTSGQSSANRQSNKENKSTNNNNRDNKKDSVPTTKASNTNRNQPSTNSSNTNRNQPSTKSSNNNRSHAQTTPSTQRARGKRHAGQRDQGKGQMHGERIMMCAFQAVSQNGCNFTV